MSLHSFMSADLLGIYLSMSLLFLFSFSGGALIVWLFFSLTFIYIRRWFKLFVSFLGVLRVLFIFLINQFITLTKLFYSLLFYCSLIWNLPRLSTFFYSNLLSLSFNYLKHFDQGWAEFMGSQGLYNSLISYGFLTDFSNLLNYKNLFLLFFIIYGLIFFIY